MKANKKKYILGTLATLAIVAPVTTLVACGSSADIPTLSTGDAWNGKSISDLETELRETEDSAASANFLSQIKYEVAEKMYEKEQKSSFDFQEAFIKWNIYTIKREQLNRAKEILALFKTDGTTTVTDAQIKFDDADKNDPYYIGKVIGQNSTWTYNYDDISSYVAGLQENAKDGVDSVRQTFRTKIASFKSNQETLQKENAKLSKIDAAHRASFDWDATGIPSDFPKLLKPIEKIRQLQSKAYYEAKDAFIENYRTKGDGTVEWSKERPTKYDGATTDEEAVKSLVNKSIQSAGFTKYNYAMNESFTMEQFLAVDETGKKIFPWFEGQKLGDKDSDTTTISATANAAATAGNSDNVKIFTNSAKEFLKSAASTANVATNIDVSHDGAQYKFNPNLSGYPHSQFIFTGASLTRIGGISATNLGTSLDTIETALRAYVGALSSSATGELKTWVDFEAANNNSGISIGTFNAAGNSTNPDDDIEIRINGLSSDLARKLITDFFASTPTLTTEVQGFFDGIKAEIATIPASPTPTTSTTTAVAQPNGYAQTDLISIDTKNVRINSDIITPLLNNKVYFLGRSSVQTSEIIADLTSAEEKANFDGNPILISHVLFGATQPDSSTGAWSIKKEDLIYWLSFYGSETKDYANQGIHMLETWGGLQTSTPGANGATWTTPATPATKDDAKEASAFKTLTDYVTSDHDKGVRKNQGEMGVMSLLDYVAPKKFVGGWNTGTLVAIADMNKANIHDTSMTHALDTALAGGTAGSYSATRPTTATPGQKLIHNLITNLWNEIPDPIKAQIAAATDTTAANRVIANYVNKLTDDEAKNKFGYVMTDLLGLSDPAKSQAIGGTGIGREAAYWVRDNIYAVPSQFGIHFMKIDSVNTEWNTKLLDDLKKVATEKSTTKAKVKWAEIYKSIFTTERIVETLIKEQDIKDAISGIVTTNTTLFDEWVKNNFVDVTGLTDNAAKGAAIIAATEKTIAAIKLEKDSKAAREAVQPIVNEYLMGEIDKHFVDPTIDVDALYNTFMYVLEGMPQPTTTTTTTTPTTIDYTTAANKAAIDTAITALQSAVDATEIKAWVAAATAVTPAGSWAVDSIANANIIKNQEDAIIAAKNALAALVTNITPSTLPATHATAMAGVKALEDAKVARP